MKNLKMTLFQSYACLAMLVTGCGVSTTESFDESSLDEPPGIMSVENSGNQIILNVLLKDQFKLQLFEGEVAGPQVWMSSANHPASVLIHIEGKTLTMGSFSGEFDTEGIQINTELPEDTSGVREILIATRETEGKKVPITVRMVPTTPEEKAVIHGDE